MIKDMFSSVNLLEKGVNAAWLRHQVISNNIANVDTPGFKKSTVEFESLMAEALGENDGTLSLKRTDERHLPQRTGNPDQVEARVVTQKDTSAGLDENNVDIEEEMVELAKNTIAYYTMINKINSEFRKLDTAINVT